jgi:hypothetical protein
MTAPNAVVEPIHPNPSIGHMRQHLAPEIRIDIFR